MAGKSLVVKYQVLEGSFFDGLQHEAVRTVDRGDHLDRAAFQDDGFGRAVSRADAASQADVFIDGRPLFLHGYRKDRTDSGTFSTGNAGLCLDLRQIVRGLDGLHRTEFLRGPQGFAAAAAAVAHESRMLPHIFPDLDQVMLVGHLQDILRFLFGDESRVAPVFRQGAGDVVKGEARLQRSVLFARDPEVQVLVAAVADPDADVLRLLDDMRSSFIVQDMCVALS